MTVAAAEPSAQPPAPPKGERTLDLPSQLFAQMFEYILKNPVELLHVPACLEAIVRYRFELLRDGVRSVEEEQQTDVRLNTVHKNFTNLARGVALQRPAVLFRALHTVDGFRKIVSKARLLTIGPRSEAEIFLAFSHGFHAANVVGLDLMSYSPWIDVGDAHRLPYPDASFDVVTIGWVLAYSHAPEKILAEARRVTRPGGYIAVGCQFIPEGATTPTYEKPVKTKVYSQVSEVYELFAEPRPALVLGTEPEDFTGQGDVIVVVRVPPALA